MLSLAWLYHKILALDALLFVLMEMVHPKSVVMMAAVDLVELALQDNIAVMELVVVNPTVLADSAVMMVVVAHLVVFALLPKHAPMVSVLELPLLIVLEDNVETTELEEAAVLALLVKDAELDNVSAIMAVMREIVAMLLNQTEPTLDCAPQDLVELAQLDLPAQPMEDVLQFSNVLLLLPLLIVLLEDPYPPRQQLVSHKAHTPDQ